MDQENDHVDEAVAEVNSDHAAETVVEDVDTEEGVENESSDETLLADYEDVEYEGKNYNLPKELKRALLREEDYTRKTQEVAEDRKSLAQQQKEFKAAAARQQESFQQYAYLSSLDGQLQQYGQINWNEWSETDPTEAQKAFMQFNQMKDHRAQVLNDLQNKEREALQTQQSAIATQKEQGRQALVREIPDWSPQLASDLQTHGTTYGYTPEELAFITDTDGCIDPRAARVLHDAYRYRQSLNKATAQPKTAVKPVRAIKGKSAGKKGLHEITNTDDWMRERNKQIAKQRAS